MATAFNGDYVAQTADTQSVASTVVHHVAAGAAAGLLAAAMVVVASVTLVGAVASAAYKPVAVYRYNKRQRRGS